MNPQQLKSILEAALFAAGEPLSIERMLALFEEAEQPSRDAIREALKSLDEEYAERGVELKEVASGYRFQARQSVARWVSRLWEERPARYSRALLETLALIAYRQPITRAEIEDIRGVAVSSNIMKTLQEREWVRVVGHRDVPGKPAMFATTRAFLDYFNLSSLDQLPTLAELRDIDKINQELDLQVPGEGLSRTHAANDGMPDVEPNGEEAPTMSAAAASASLAEAALEAWEQESPYVDENE